MNKFRRDFLAKSGTYTAGGILAPATSLLPSAAHAEYGKPPTTGFVAEYLTIDDVKYTYLTYSNSTWRAVYDKPYTSSPPLARAHIEHLYGDEYYHAYNWTNTWDVKVPLDTRAHRRLATVPPFVYPTGTETRSITDGTISNPFSVFSIFKIMGYAKDFVLIYFLNRSNVWYYKVLNTGDAADNAFYVEYLTAQRDVSSYWSSMYIYGGSAVTSFAITLLAASPLLPTAAIMALPMGLAFSRSSLYYRYKYSAALLLMQNLANRMNAQQIV